MALAWQAGDRAAGAALLKLHSGIIYTFARRYLKWGIPLDDLLQSARYGFLKGLLTWKPDSGSLPVSWAVYYIRTELVERVAKDGYPIAVSRDAHRDNVRGVKTGKGPQDWARSAVPLDAPVDQSQGASAETRVALLVADHEPDEFQGERLALSATLMAELDKLPPREAEVLRRGVLGGESLTAIGASWGVCRERARQIEARAMERLRKRCMARA